MEYKFQFGIYKFKIKATPPVVIEQIKSVIVPWGIMEYHDTKAHLQLYTKLITPTLLCLDLLPIYIKTLFSPKRCVICGEIVNPISYEDF